ncbi:MAG: T9SS type A sorting domain-containing protein [Calditrichia bacterium]|nr:T9SS type A sorting domain-containing protein [Calditrichia bacterium]
MKKTFYILLLFVLFSFNSKGNNNQWQVLGNMPHSVSGGEAIALDSFIVVLGGNFDSLGMPVNFIQIYYPHSNRWEFASSMNENRYGFVADKYGDSSIVSCGGVWEPSINLFSLEIWNYKNPEPPQIYNHDYNFGRVYLSGHVYNERLFLIGGFNSPAIGDSLLLPYITEYNIPLATTVSTTNAVYNPVFLPYHQMTVIKNDEIFIAGGSYYWMLDGIYKFNVNTYAFQQAGNLMEPRAGGEAVSDSELIYIIGGYNESRDALNTVEIYNTITDSIWAGPLLNFERKELMAVKFENSIYVFGGVNNFLMPVPTVEKLDLITAIDDFEPEKAESFRLGNNYPNPFNSTTNIVFKLEKGSDISLDIYTITGQHVKNIVRKNLSIGEHIYEWDGKDNSNRDVASGVYIYQLKNSEITLSKKMILLR